MDIAVAQDSNLVSLQARAQGGDFAGGLNENKNRKPNQSPSLLNTYVNDDGVLSVRPRGKNFLNLAFYGKRAFSWQGTDNVERNAITNNETIYTSDNLKTYTKVPDAAGTGDLALTAGYECRMTSYHNSLYWTNGKDNPGYWDGGVNSTPITWFVAGDIPRIIFTFQDRLWFLNSATNPNYLRYSEIGGATYTATNEIPLPSDQSGQGTGMARSVKGLVIFLNDSVWLLAGYSAETFSLICIDSTRGCANGDSIQYSPDGNIIFLSQGGLCKTNGLEVVPLQDFVPNTIKSISQIYKWNRYEDALLSTQWEHELDSSTRAFIPNGTDNAPPTVFFEYEHLYTDGFGYATIPEGNFPAGQGDWTGTTVDGTIDWNVGNITYTTPLVMQGIGTSYSYLPERIQTEVVLYCMDTGEEVVTETWKTTGIYLGNGKYTYDATLLGVEYHGKRFRFILRFKTVDLPSGSNGPVRVDMEITSPEFFVNTINAPSQFSFDYTTTFTTANDPCYIKLENFLGACQFKDMEYISKTQEVVQKKFGNVNIGFKDYALEFDDLGGYIQIDVAMAFSADAGATWGAWVNIYDGVTDTYVIDSNISSYDTNAAGLTNAIRYKISVNSTGRSYPLRFNSIAWDWYNSLEDVPQSSDNISSAMWNDRYLLAYTKAGDTVNKFILTYDEASGIPRYQKWYFPNGISFFTTYANKLHYGYNIYGTNILQFYKLLEPGDVTGEALYDCHYFFEEMDMGMPGIQKSFDTLTLLYDKFGQTVDELKVEIWIDGKYNGDLDIWLRKATASGEYFSLKHSALVKYSVQINTGNVIYMLPGFYAVGYNFWTRINVPFGWGNKIQFRLFWGRPSVAATPTDLQCEYGVETLKEMSVDALFFKDVYQEPGLNLHEGNL
jgi:hypothetical protein